MTRQGFLGWLGANAALVAGASVAHGQAPTGTAGAAGVTVPLDFDGLTPPGLRIWVRLNGSEPFPCLLDTLLETDPELDLIVDTSIHQALVKAGKAKDNADKSDTVYRLETVELVDPRTGTGGPVGDEAAWYWTMDLASVSRAYNPQRPFLGVLGRRLFQNGAVRLDFVKKTLTFYPKGTPAPKPAGTTAVPLEAEERGGMTIPLRVTVLRPIGTLDADEKPAPRESSVDTKAYLASATLDTFLPAGVATRLDPRFSVRQGWRSNLGGVESEYESWRADELTLGTIPDATRAGGVVEKNVEINTLLDNGRYRRGLVGLRFLSRYVVTLDAPNKVLLLEKAADYDMTSRLAGRADVQLLEAANAEYWQVADVISGSPADDAGLAGGDTVLAVDGRDVRGLTVGTVRTLLDGYADTEATVKVRRPDGEEATFRYRRDSLFTPRPAPKPGIGLQANMSTVDGKDVFTVTGVLPDLPAARAGLRAGDTLKTVNGIPFAAKNIPKINPLLKKPDGKPLVFEIERKDPDGTVRPMTITVNPPKP